MTLRIAALAALIATHTAVANAQQLDANRFDSPGRMHEYIHALIGPGALLGLAASTAYDQYRKEPPEWGGSEGWGQRLASNAGRLVVQETVHHGLAAVMDRSTWYVRCDCTGGARITHAFAEAVTDHTRGGATMLSVPRIAGAYAGAFAQGVWRPGVSTGDALVFGTTSLVFTGVINVWHEFVK